MAKGKPRKQNMQNIYVYIFGVVGRYKIKRDVRKFLSFSCHSNFMLYPHEETHSTKPDFKTSLEKGFIQYGRGNKRNALYHD